MYPKVPYVVGLAVLRTHKLLIFFSLNHERAFHLSLGPDKPPLPIVTWVLCIGLLLCTFSNYLSNEYSNDLKSIELTKTHSSDSMPYTIYSSVP